MIHPTVETIILELRNLANPKAKSIYERQSQKEEVLGVNRGPLRALANSLKPNHELALGLWESELFEARIMAAMLFDPKRLDEETLSQLIESTPSIALLDELCFDVFESYPDPLAFFEHHRTHTLVSHRRSAYNTAISMAMNPKTDSSILDHFLTLIKQDSLSEYPEVQYAMNRCLVEIGVRHDAYTNRCIQLGEALGLYKDVKVAKGCTSPYAPEWIRVARYNRSRR